jgi:membrane associated rhomboid family serine protease
MFFLPLSDDNALLRPAFVVWLIIAACTVVYIWQFSLSPEAGERATVAFGMIPARVLGHAILPRSLSLVPPWATLVTHMFMHGSWLHLIGNMWFLRIFGDNVEEAMGRTKFTAFYLIAGVAAAMTQATIGPLSHIPMVGASGAIAGVLGAYLVLYPRANVRVLMILFVFIRIINVPAVLVLGAWFMLQLISAELASANAGGVAFWAHVGGFLCGILLLPIFKGGHIPMFAEAQSRPFAISGPRAWRSGRIPTVTPGRRPGDDGPWNRGPWS